jgi:hypothetical protein
MARRRSRFTATQTPAIRIPAAAFRIALHVHVDDALAIVSNDWADSSAPRK